MTRDTNNYGPNLTPKQKAKLLKEIAQFDKEKTLRIIEQESTSRPDLNMADIEPSKKDGFRANPDLLSEEAAITYSRPLKDNKVEIAKKELNVILSHREAQVWQKVMREGLTTVETAAKLHISQQTVSGYLKSAQRKIERHFK